MNMLGAVAKGVFGKGGGLKVPTEEEEIEDLLNRVAEGGIAEDRREALSQLRDITIDNPKAQLALGGMGMPILIEILREEREDVELVKGAVECLHSAIVRPSHEDDSLQGKDPPAWVINAEMFARGKDNISLLLSLLEDEPVGINDFYVRYHTVQLLASLLQANPYKLQEAFMLSRTGLSKLMALLSDNEVLRNETILLLQRLAHGHEEIQKIVAFEGGFEKLFSVMKEEGGPEGGVVVQDCWDLLSSLLMNSAKTQLMFREMGFLTHFASFLQVPEDNGLPAAHTHQKVLNLCAALNCMRVLLTPSKARSATVDSKAEQNRIANQALLAKDGAMDSLIVWAVDRERVPSPRVRAMALQCLSLIISACRPNQDKLGTARVPTPSRDGPPLVQAVLRTALYSSSHQERIPACQLLHAFCDNNPDGHAALASTLTPVQDIAAGTPGSFGEELLVALSSAEMSQSGRAAAVLTLLLDGNYDAKQRLSSMTVGSGRVAENLVSLVVKQVQASLTLPGTDAHVAAVELLRLIITWCRDCPPVVSVVLSSHSHLPFLVDVIKGRVGHPNDLISGLAVIVLATLLKSGQSARSTPAPPAGAPPPAFTPASLLDVITSRIGLSDFFGRLDALLQEPMVAPQAQDGTREADAGNSQYGSPASSEEGATPFDDAFVGYLHSTATWVRSEAMSAYTRPFGAADGPPAAVQVTGSSKAEKLSSALAAIEALQRELMEVKSRNSALAQDVLRLSSGAGAASSTAPAGTPGSSASVHDAAALAAAEVRASQAEAQLGLLQAEKDTLHLQMSSLKSEAASCRQQADLSRSEAQKYQADLEDLSSAYNQLETHAFQLEAQVHEANQKLREADLKLQQALASSSGGGGVSDAEFEARIAAAVEAAVAETAEENDESMNDLLVCLGQEEQKVERLRNRLGELGEDVDALLEGIGVDENEGEDEEA